MAVCWVMVEPPRASPSSSASSIAALQLAPVDAAMAAERASSDAITVRASTGAMRSSGTKVRSTRAPVIQRHSISGRDRIEDAIERRQQIGQQQQSR